MRSSLKRPILLGLLVGLFIPVKLFWEMSLSEQRTACDLNNVSLNVHLRSQLSQNLAVALLGGFRGSVADFIWLKAHDAWMDQIWYKLKEGIHLAVILQPKSIHFWDLGSWHMAYNASYGEGENPRYPSDAYRIKARQSWMNDGKSFLAEGIRNNPDSWVLHFRLGYLHSDPFKYNDPLESLPHLHKAFQCKGAPSYVDRMIGQMYLRLSERAKTPEEHEKYLLLAYERWIEILRSGRADGMELKLTQWGWEAEQKLKIPPSQRKFPSKDIPPQLK